MRAETVAAVQAQMRRWLRRALARRVLRAPEHAAAMRVWAHGGGFSLDVSVRIEADECAGPESVLRYCGRPAPALERLREIDAEHLAQLGPGGNLTLTPVELLKRLAVLIPSPRRRRHCHFGVLVANAPPHCV